MSYNLDRIIRRTQGHFYQDGLAEMLIGLLFLGVGLLFQLWVTFNASSPWNLFMAIGLPILVIGGVTYLQTVIRRLKERVTYPRSGYATYAKKQPTRVRWLLAVVPLGLAIASLLLPQWLSAMSIAEGALLGLVLIVIGARAGLRRFYLMGGLSLLLGLVAAIITPGELPGTAFTFAGSGTILLVSGAITFRRYLQRYPKSAETVT